MNNENTAIILILLSSLFFALMALMVKFVESYPIHQMLFFRGIMVQRTDGKILAVKTENGPFGEALRAKLQLAPVETLHAVPVDLLLKDFRKGMIKGRSRINPGFETKKYSSISNPYFAAG